jgi:hypothetical protein
MKHFFWNSLVRVAQSSVICQWITAKRCAFTKTSLVAEENTFVSSPNFKKKDKTETKSLNMIGARFNVSMQQEPGFAARPYLKTRSFRWRDPCSMLVE